MVSFWFSEDWLYWNGLSWRGSGLLHVSSCFQQSSLSLFIRGLMGASRAGVETCRIFWSHGWKLAHFYFAELYWPKQVIRPDSKIWEIDSIFWWEILQIPIAQGSSLVRSVFTVDHVSSPNSESFAGEFYHIQGNDFNLAYILMEKRISENTVPSHLWR